MTMAMIMETMMMTVRILKMTIQNIFFQPFVAARTWERPAWQTAVAKQQSFYTDHNDDDGDDLGDGDADNDDGYNNDSDDIIKVCTKSCWMVQGVFLHWASRKKLKYGKPR